MGLVKMIPNADRLTHDLPALQKVVLTRTYSLRCGGEEYVK